MGKALFKNKLASLIFVLCCANKILCLVFAFNKFGIIQPGLLISSLLWVLIGVYILLYGIKPNGKICLFIMFILLFLIFSNFFHSGYIKSINILFIQYCLPGLVISMFSYDFKLIIKYSNIITICLLPFLLQMFSYYFNSTWQEVIPMEVCYSLIPLIFLNIISFTYNEKENKIIRIITIIVNFALLLVLLLRGNRGLYLCVMSFFLFLYLSKKQIRNKNQLLFSVLLFVLLFIIVLNVDYVLSLLSSFFSSHNINVNFFNKTSRLLSQGDVSNGRIEHYIYAINGFYDYPIFGNGIGTFKDVYPSMSYPHNILLQVLYEGGIILFISIILLLFKSFKILNFEKNTDYKNIINVLFSASIPALMLSSELWVFPTVWLMFGLCMVSKLKGVEVKNENTV